MDTTNILEMNFNTSIDAFGLPCTVYRDTVSANKDYDIVNDPIDYIPNTPIGILKCVPVAPKTTYFIGDGGTGVVPVGSDKYRLQVKNGSDIQAGDVVEVSIASSLLRYSVESVKCQGFYTEVVLEN